jgi:hypothetical protein
MYRFTEDQIQQRELRAAAYHEAGHLAVYRRFGGDGDALVWKNLDRRPDETAWCGQFRVRVCPQQMHDDAKDSGIPVPDLAPNWEVLCGMAGLVAEEILAGENTDADLIAEALESRIQYGEASSTDLAAMNVSEIEDCELNLDDVEKTWMLLLEEWMHVQQDAEHLIEEAKHLGYAATKRRHAQPFLADSTN